jgi:hypothetical protein
MYTDGADKLKQIQVVYQSPFLRCILYARLRRVLSLTDFGLRF